MGTGYTRNDVSNNIANGNVINASDLDGEFDALVAAFNNSTGHTHDGTTAEGAPIEVVGPAQEVLITATTVEPDTTNSVDIGTATKQFKDAYFDGTIDSDGLTVTGTATFSGATVSDLGTVTTADIDGGTIDGTAIGGNTAAAGTFTTLVVNTSSTIDLSNNTSSGDLAVGDGGTGASTASAARTNLGVEIGTDVQAWDAQLDDLSGLAVTNGNFIVGNGTNWVAESGATARTSLGLGSIATQDANNVSISGGSVTGITDITVADGGTGASTASNARTNLGVAIGSDVQAWDAQLDDIAALAVTDGNFIVGDGTNWVAESGSTARTSLGLGTIATQNANNVSISGGSITGITDLAIADGGTGSSTASGARTALGVAIGSDVQAYDAGLADIAGLAVTDGNFIVGNGTNWVAESGTTVRTSLGLGSIATQDANNVSITGGSITGITDLAIADGGTGASDASGARTNLGLGTAAVEDVAAGGSGDLLRADGDGSSLTGIQTGFRNRVINGGFSVAQRGTSFTGGTANADDAYTLDRWYILSEGSDSIDVTQNTAEAPGTGEYCIALDVETTGEKFGIAQIIEARECAGLIGETVTLSLKAKVSNARIDTVKAAIVAWSGTADSVTSDIISTWNADGTTPTLIANATFENTPADLGVTTSWATYSVSADIDTASAKNIVVFIWSDDATNPTAGDFLYITDVQLELGSTATDFERRPYGVELALCQRYFYQLDETGAGGDYDGVGQCEGTTSAQISVPVPVPMRAAATISLKGGSFGNYGIYTGGAVRTPSALSSSSLPAGKLFARLAIASSSLTTGQAAHLIGQGTSGGFLFDAEL